jgi:asparagine synthetase B (glutamine-hydrolysing)
VASPRSVSRNQPVANDALHHRRPGNQIASEVKAQFAAGVPAHWDHESFYHHATGTALPDRTVFEGVSQVPPGHYLLATRSKFRLLRYWDFNCPTATDRAAQKGGD